MLVPGASRRAAPQICVQLIQDWSRYPSELRLDEWQIGSLGYHYLPPPRTSCFGQRHFAVEQGRQGVTRSRLGSRILLRSGCKPIFWIAHSLQSKAKHGGIWVLALVGGNVSKSPSWLT